MKSGFAAAQTQTISSGIWKSFKQQEEQDYFQLNIFHACVFVFVCFSQIPECKFASPEWQVLCLLCCLSSTWEFSPLRSHMCFTFNKQYTFTVNNCPESALASWIYIIAQHPSSSSVSTFIYILLRMAALNSINCFQFSFFGLAFGQFCGFALLIAMN